MHDIDPSLVTGQTIVLAGYRFITRILMAVVLFNQNLRRMATLDHLYGAQQLEEDSSDDEEATAGNMVTGATDTTQGTQPSSPSKSVTSGEGALSEVEEETLEDDEDTDDNKKEDDSTSIPGAVQDDDIEKETEKDEEEMKLDNLF